MLPGTRPPTSDECTKHQAKQISFPSKNSGLKSMMSGRCVHMPRVVCGSFVTMTSPGSSLSRPIWAIAGPMSMPSMFVTPMLRG